MQELTPDATSGNSAPLVDNSIDAFLKEVEKPTTPAPGTTIPSEPAPAYEIPAMPPPGPAPEPPRKPDEPMFKQEEPEPERQEQAPPKHSADYKRKMVRSLLLGEDFATSRICGIVGGTDEYAQFMYTEEDLNTILDLLEPYYDMIIAKVPGWLPLIVVYGGFKTQQIMRAAKVHKTNKANSAARTDPNVANKVANAFKAQEEKPRTNFKINKKGEYIYDRYGKYLKVDEPKELANIADIDRILDSNKVSDVQAAFNLSDDYLRAKGIEL